MDGIDAGHACGPEIPPIEDTRPGWASVAVSQNEPGEYEEQADRRVAAGHDIAQDRRKALLPEVIGHHVQSGEEAQTSERPQLTTRRARPLHHAPTSPSARSGAYSWSSTSMLTDSTRAGDAAGNGPDSAGPCPRLHQEWSAVL